MESPDPLITCPYNKSHQILKSRMQYHLSKCRKVYADADCEICFLDSTHHIPKPELQYHLTVCPSRKVFECSRYTTTDSMQAASLPEYKSPSLPPPSENWDEDLVTTTYQPSLRATEVPVLRQLNCASKSERKKFRLQERRRVQELQEKGYSISEEQKNLPKSNAPLRLPNSLVGHPKNPDMGLGRGSSSQSEDKGDPVAEFSNLSMSRGRGGGARSNGSQ